MSVMGFVISYRAAMGVGFWRLAMWIILIVMRSLVSEECDVIEAEPRHRGPAMTSENADIRFLAFSTVGKIQYAIDNLNLKVASMKRHWLTNPTVPTVSNLG